MIKLRTLLFATIVLALFSCEKEYSLENSVNGGSNLIVGINCRISKIVYTDTGAKKGIGSVEALINSLDFVTRITRFDSVSNTIEDIFTPTYINDTAFINVDEYFVVDANKRVSKLHGLIDPTDPFSLQFEVIYTYNGLGYLVSKDYFFSFAPTVAYYRVDYTYAEGNLKHMTGTDLTSGDLFMDADISYYSELLPQRYMYIFPDELAYANFTQFYNFGVKNFNAVKKLTVRNYDPGNIVRDSLVSDFSNYIMSRDNYVLSVQMGGDDQESIPAAKGKLSFSYTCK